MRKLFIISVLGFIIHTALFAGVTGKIAGHVIDSETGNPLPGCNIVIEGTYLGAASSLDGDFIILNIPPGTYVLKAIMIGYAPVNVEGVVVTIDHTTNLNIEMRVEAIKGETVLVIYDRPVVQVDRTSSQVHLSEDLIADLPVQEVNDLLEMQSGVTKDAGGGLHIRGGRGSEVVYWVDGIPVTDGYDGSSIVEVDKNAIQELQLISGTFNAEYGQAMSGIINIVTQTGGKDYHGSIDLSTGGYWATSDDIMKGTDKYKPFTTQNFSASISGPTFTEKFRFHLSGRKYISNGWLKGYNYFLPTGEPGDSSIANMNWQDKYSVNGKLSFFLTPNVNLHFNALFNGRDYQDYNHFFKWNPKGNLFRYDDGNNISMTLNHTINPRTVYTFKISRSYSEYKHYLYENPLDSRYVHPDSLSVPGYTFSTSGTDLGHFYRNSKTALMKFDFTSQVTNKHLVKFGGEYRKHQLELEYLSIQAKKDEFGVEITPFIPDTLGLNTPSHGYYEKEPEEFSLYFQDKLEYENFIVNVGLRFDYFNSNGKVLADPEDPNIYYPFKKEHINMTMQERENIWYKKVGPKTSLSPRLGLAFPITDQGVIHFSYGHFFQIPSFQYLYSPVFKIPTSGGTYGPYGNPDLEPKRTVMYELGLQQQITAGLSLDVTMFYRDIRDWVSTSVPIQTTLPGVKYVIYRNRDYANCRGVVLSIKESLANSLFLNLEYTYQVAEGSNSNPDQEFFSLLGNNEPTHQITPLDWDQRHTLNGAMTYRWSNWKSTLTARYGAGYPYTPSYGISTRTGLSVDSVLPNNSRRKPSTIEVDLKISRSFKFNKLTGSFYCNINNLLDTRNANNVFTDTGEPDYTTRIPTIGRDVNSKNTVEEFIVYPHWYSIPREILFGIKISI
jgi:outer membrane receptor for ferrienterochelin and colicin